MGFLNESDIEPFDLKVDFYIKSLETIFDREQGARKERARVLLDSYREGGDRKIAKDWDKERKSGKTNVSSININNSSISGSGIGTIERGTFTSGLQKKRDQKETNPRKRANNTTAQRIKKIKTAKGLSASDSSTNESQKFDEHDVEEEIRSHTELNLANVVTSDYETTTRECSSDEMGESSENNTPNDSDSNETIEIKHDELEELEQQISFGSLSEWEVGTVNVSKKI